MDNILFRSPAAAFSLPERGDVTIPLQLPEGLAYCCSSKSCLKSYGFDRRPDVWVVIGEHSQDRFSNSFHLKFCNRERKCVTRHAVVSLHGYASHRRSAASLRAFSISLRSSMGSNMIRRPKRKPLSFPVLMSRLRDQWLRPMILAASSIVSSGSSGEFSCVSTRQSAEQFFAGDL